MRLRQSSKLYGSCAGILVAAVSCTPVPRAAYVAGGATTAAVAPAPAAAGTVADPLPVLLAPPAADATGDAAAPPAPDIAPPFAAVADANDAERAVACLTEAVYYEARSEPVDGQRAVAQVVLNRVRNPAFPANVCGVVHQRSAATGVCQFSYYCDGAMAARREPAAWEIARRVATAAFNGAVYAPAGAATFYHTNAVSPWWSGKLTRIASIGAHIFYRLGDAMSRRLDFRQAYAAAEPVGAAIEADDARTAKVVRYLVAVGAAVTVHRGAADIEGVVVHRGGSEPGTVREFAGIRIHTGDGKASTAPAPEVVASKGPAEPDPA